MFITFIIVTHVKRATMLPLTRNKKYICCIGRDKKRWKEIRTQKPAKISSTHATTIAVKFIFIKMCKYHADVVTNSERIIQGRGSC